MPLIIRSYLKRILLLCNNLYIGVTIVETPADRLARIDKLILKHLLVNVDPDISVKPVEATIKLYGDLIHWFRTDQSFSGWVDLSKKYYYGDAFMGIDRDGEIRRELDAYFAMDLHPYFIEFVQLNERDIELLAVKMYALQLSLGQIIN